MNHSFPYLVAEHDVASIKRTLDSYSTPPNHAITI